MENRFARRTLLGSLLVFCAAPAFAQGSDLSAATRTRSGLGIVDVRVGTGEAASSGRTARVHYTGWLLENGARGKKFDSSRDRGQPFEFPVGAGRVIKGWDEGVAGMKIGGQRTLVVPADLGYGARGAGNAIPPNAALVFDVELLGLR
ncbi:MAG: FKBP-type peptidyl-prolyl cis-trans isomerase [Rhodospirillales bacterium]|nr:FKBP-type peptidyl-prolyl cis-trans isomerase [Rhodospirillales bacterium]